MHVAHIELKCDSKVISRGKMTGSKTLQSWFQMGNIRIRNNNIFQQINSWLLDQFH